MTINKVMVIGAGQMGGGIAQSFAESGYEVFLNDINQEFVEKGLSVIEKRLNRLVDKGKKTEAEVKGIMQRITLSTTYEQAKEVDLVVEAATENPTIKLDIFRQLDELCGPEAILASNTSSLSITMIAAATTRQDQVIGLHFFNLKQQQ